MFAWYVSALVCSGFKVVGYACVCLGRCWFVGLAMVRTC